ncbi:hypothetical protein JCM5353_008532 [Sporobolomyces roseus]
MIPSRPSQPSITTTESVSTRLNRLRSEQAASTRSKFTSTSTRSHSNTPAWLRVIDERNVRRVVRGRRGTAGPPPPPSWNSDSILSTSIKGQPSKPPRLKAYQLVERRKIVQPLVADANPLEGNACTVKVESLFSIAGGTIARDLSFGPDYSILLEHIAYLPTSLKIRLLDCFADWRNESSLTNEGAKELLRTDLDELDSRDDVEWCDDDSSNDDERGEGKGKEIEEQFESLRFEDEFATPMSTSLTRLDLSFSSINLKTLRTLLLRPSSPQTSTLVTSPTPASIKLLPIFPQLHTLLVASTPHLTIHDSFYSLLSSLLSLRVLSLAGKLLPTTAISTFLPRLSVSTPLLREIDLSYMEFDAKEVMRRIDWEGKWNDVKVIGLRREDSENEESGGTMTTTKRKERLKKEIREWVASKRKRGKWLDVVL